MVPPTLDQAQQEELKGAVEQPPTASGMELANWYWKVVRQLVSQRFSVSLCRSSCLNYLHRLGFSFKRPRKRLVKADEAKREAFVRSTPFLGEVAGRTGAKIFFADEAYFRAHVELRGKWALKGEPALVDSTSPSYGKRPATTRRFAWRPAKWNGWYWKETATAKARWSSWNSCATSTAGRSA